MVHFDKSRRQEAIDAISAAVGQRVDFACDVWAVVDTTDVVGGVVVNGDEVHIGLTRYVFLRAIFRELMPPILERFGYIRTMVRSSHTKGIKFVTRLGFQLVADYDGVSYFRLYEARHV